MPDQTSEPLDPQAAAVIAKARRLMLVTIGITFLALAVVLMIVGYRVMNAGAPPGAGDAALQLPAGAKVLSTAVSDGKIMVTVDINGAAEILSFDQKTLKPVGRIQLKPQP